MTTEARNRKPLAYGLIVAGFVLQISAAALMLLVDDPDVVQPGGVLLICGMGLGWGGITLLRKHEQG